MGLGEYAGAAAKAAAIVIITLYTLIALATVSVVAWRTRSWKAASVTLAAFIVFAAIWSIGPIMEERERAAINDTANRIASSLWQQIDLPWTPADAETFAHFSRREGCSAITPGDGPEAEYLYPTGEDFPDRSAAEAARAKLGAWLRAERWQVSELYTSDGQPWTYAKNTATDVALEIESSEPDEPRPGLRLAVTVHPCGWLDVVPGDVEDSSCAAPLGSCVDPGHSDYRDK